MSGEGLAVPCLSETSSLTEEDTSPTEEATLPTEEATLPAAEGEATFYEEAALQEEAALHEETALPELLLTLLAQAQELAQAGGLSKHATDAQKWQAADLVHAMQREVEARRDRLLAPFVPATPEAKAGFQRAALAYNAFLRTQERTRNTLVDSALTAAAFPPGHPVREGRLSFSHARTLSRLVTERERTAWAARAEREGLSVARLWALILTEGGAGTSRSAPTASASVASGAAASGAAASMSASRGLASGVSSEESEAEAENEAGAEAESLRYEAGTASEAFVTVAGRGTRRWHHAHICAFTGHKTENLAVMVEVRVHLDGAGSAALSPSVVRQASQGGAARRGADGVPGSFPVLLRFADLAAVQH